MRILGIDPGSRLTGYGCIDWISNRLHSVTHGTVTLSRTSGKQDTPLEDRLLLIYHGLTAVIEATRPQVMVIERVFFAKNAVSALKLGQARGAAILTGKIHGLAIFEYSPSEVKQALVGQGHADKDQVARMVELLIGKQSFATSDASDGMALAICHAHSMRTVAAFAGAPASPAALAYAQALRSASGQRKKKGGSLADALGLSAEKIGGRKRVTPDKMR